MKKAQQPTVHVWTWSPASSQPTLSSLFPFVLYKTAVRLASTAEPLRLLLMVGIQFLGSSPPTATSLCKIQSPFTPCSLIFTDFTEGGGREEGREGGESWGKERKDTKTLGKRKRNHPQTQENWGKDYTLYSISPLNLLQSYSVK